MKPIENRPDTRIITNQDDRKALRRMVEHAAMMARDHGFVAAVYRLNEALEEIDKEISGSIPRA
ncbi:hypothetical protein FF098_000515 [Parvularcula flava]|uniref:Uncharacterized protein n=1 Tax=Aquisalinus luteolus TaxID=1566827 RepID=A0A8J3A021_9PROT|nr:hypothetical protein [Aquisalinus luteolus]NHK26383.1 hypothetical protein [Aquisalinus luteolus]GGH92169.1 hypothetical protein GCM10011355_01030 [Aquisalinus luteolus]